MELISIPDECLSAIFTLLPLKDQLRCSQVCRRFHQLQLPLCTVGTTHLDVKQLPFGSSKRFATGHSGPLVHARAVLAALSTVVPSFKGHLVSISFESCEMAPENFDLLCNLVPNLRVLHINVYNNMIGLERLPIQLRRLTLLRSFSYLVSWNENNRKQRVEVPEWSTTIIGWKYLKELKLVGQPGFSVRNGVLTTLIIKDFDLTNDEFSVMCSNCSNLESLNADLSTCRTISPTPVAQLHKLTFLNLVAPICSQFVRLTDLVQIACGCRLLKTFYLRQHNLLSELGGLQQLSLVSVEIPIGSDWGLSQVANIATLKCLKIFARDITDAGLLQLADNAATLEELKISFPSFPATSSLSDSGIVAVLAGCSNLRHLSLNNVNITDVSVTAIAHKWPPLEQISLIGCRNVTEIGIEEFLNKRRNSEFNSLLKIRINLNLNSALIKRLTSVNVTLCE